MWASMGELQCMLLELVISGVCPDIQVGDTSMVAISNMMFGEP